jgi:putative transposase
MTIRRELLDELLKEYETPQDILGEGGLLKELTKAVIERCLETELDMHLGYLKHGRKGNANGNVRNGHSQKTLKGEQGHVDIQVPRDRQATFEPQLVKKGQTRLEGVESHKVVPIPFRASLTKSCRSRYECTPIAAKPPTKTGGLIDRWARLAGPQVRPLTPPW